jgi:hypothetical protein
MLHRRRTTGLVGVALAIATTAACTPGTGDNSAAARSSRAVAAASSAANAKPGTYGTPADVSLPAPTKVATDAPVTVAPSVSGGDIFITYARWNSQESWAEVSGYLAGVVEDGGTCTLTLTKGGATAHATTEGISNVTSTSCGRLTVPQNQLSSGTWRAVVTYRSDTSTGTSRAAEVTVP